MHITIAQIKPKIGDLNHNAEKILDFYARAKGEIVLFPELSLCGYTPRDLFFYDGFLKECEEKMREIAENIGEKICVFGLPLMENGKLYNAMVAVKGGVVVAKSHKKHLANGSVFDEHRYFASGEVGAFTHKGLKFGLPICEDIWHEDVCLDLKNQGVDFLLVGNASPFYIGKFDERIATAKKRFEETSLPIVYCNQVLNQDGVLFDGASFYYNNGVVKNLPEFEEGILEIDLNEKGSIINNDGKMELTHKALVFGLKEYVLKSGFKKVLIGVSGGADSALVAQLAVSGFGNENVLGVFMPAGITSQESLNDARKLCENLKIEMRNIKIQKFVDDFKTELGLSGLALENIQARVRGDILMAISNQENAMVLTTGNKSEIAMGYCTLYGDMCGAYNPIKDLYKTHVFEIMKWINKNYDTKIPENIIAKEPTAELRESQKDSDSLPEYEILDKILFELIENKKRPNDLIEFEKDVIDKVHKLLCISEYKRNQACVGTKISKQSFEKSEWKFNI